MARSVRLVALVTLLCTLLAVPALAQEPFQFPTLRGKPKGGFGAQATATATAAPTETATAEPTASPTAEPTATPGRRRAALADTGSEPGQLALAGLTLLGFGLALRFRVALADARRPH